MDRQGYVHVAGKTDSTDFPTPGAFQGSSGGADVKLYRSGYGQINTSAITG